MIVHAVRALARSRPALLLAGLQLGVLAGLAVSLWTTPAFVANSELFLTTPGWNAAGTLESLEASPYRGDDFTQSRARSYVHLANNIDLARRAVARIGGGVDPAQLNRNITARVLPDTVVLEISVADPSARRAAALSDAVTAELAAEVRQLETPNGSLIATVEPVIVRNAAIPASPATPKIANNLALGAAAGLLLGFTAAYRATRHDPHAQEKP